MGKINVYPTHQEEGTDKWCKNTVCSVKESIDMTYEKAWENQADPHADSNEEEPDEPEEP